MKKLLFIFLVLFVTLTAQATLQQDSVSVLDSTAILDSYTIDEDVLVVDAQPDITLENKDGSFSNFFWSVLIFVCLFFILYIANLSLAALSVIVFSSIGLVKTSTWIDLIKRSYTSYFKSIFFLFNVILYTLLGGVLFFFINVNYRSLPVFFAITIGLVWGVLFSIPLGALFISVMRKVIRRMIKDKGSL